MNREEREKRLHECMEDQINQMLIDLEKDSKLPGYKMSDNEYFINWINLNAERFKEIWEENHK